MGMSLPLFINDLLKPFDHIVNYWFKTFCRDGFNCEGYEIGLFPRF